MFFTVCKLPPGEGGANAMDVDNDNVAMGVGGANTLVAGDTQNGAMPSQKAIERKQRFGAAVARVKREMETTRRALDVSQKLDRKFDPFAIEEMLNTSCLNILSAFHQIRSWVSSNVHLFAHSFLIAPLNNNLIEAMHGINSLRPAGESDDGCNGGAPSPKDVEDMRSKLKVKRDAFLNTSVSQIRNYNFNTFGGEFNDFNPALGQQQTELGLLAGNAKAVFRDLALQLMK